MTRERPHGLPDDAVYSHALRAWFSPKGECLLTAADAAAFEIASARSEYERKQYEVRSHVERKLADLKSMRCPSCDELTTVNRRPEDQDVYACSQCLTACVAHIRDDQVIWTEIMPHQVDAMSDESRAKLAQMTRFKPRDTRTLFRGYDEPMTTDGVIRRETRAR